MDDWNVPRQTERHLQLVTGNTVKRILVSDFRPNTWCFPSKVSNVESLSYPTRPGAVIKKQSIDLWIRIRWVLPSLPLSLWPNMISSSYPPMYLESRSSRIGHGVAYPTAKPTKTTKANSKKKNSPFLGHLGYVFALTVSDNGFGDKREATRGREVVDGFPLGFLSVLA